MGLRRSHRPRRSVAEPLEPRRLFAIEPLLPAVAVDVDAELVVQSAAIATGSGTNRPVIAYSDRDDATGKGKDVFAREFDANGRPTGPALRMNATTADVQMNPDIAAATNNTTFAVVWQSENQDGSGWGIYGRLRRTGAMPFDSGEFPVNQTAAGAQVAPRVAMDDDGRFVVTWVGRDDNGGNGTVYARRFDAAGDAVTGEVAVSVNGGAFAHTAPDVAFDTHGAVAVTWVTSDLADAGQTDVSARILDATTLAPQTGVITINTTITGDQAEPAIAAIEGGSDFLVVFSDASNGTGEATIMARHLGANGGSTDVTPVQVSQDSDGHRSRPHVSSRYTNTVIGWTQQPAGSTASASVTRTYGGGGPEPTSNEHVTTDGVSARTLHGVAVTGPGSYRDVATLGEFAGYGVASTAKLGNVLRIDGTAGDDQIFLGDRDPLTLRATVNGANRDYDHFTYDHVRVELDAGDDLLLADDTTMRISVEGWTGDDSITGSSGNDSIAGGDGNDRIEAGPGRDYAIGGTGNDVIYGQDGNDTLTGAAGKDSLYGGYGEDRISGSGSPDALYGEDGEDRIYGDDGDDRVDGGGGRDRLFGGAGRDALVGGSSNDRLYGDAGNDTLNGGTGDDVLNGGNDTDLAVKREAGDSLINIEAP